MPEYNQMQMLKRALFAMRNGVVADALRKAGSPFHIIFGVNLPQLTQIAAMHTPSAEFARQVWANSTTRESMLIAPMLMPAEEMTEQEARKWIDEAPAQEVVDVLCLKLLRKLPFALPLAQSLIADTEPMRRYAGMRLMCNLAPQYPQLAATYGRDESLKADPLTRQMAEILASYEDM